MGVTSDHPTQECTCLKRTKPSTHPVNNTLPCHREKLKQHLLDHYTFNDGRAANAIDDQPTGHSHCPPLTHTRLGVIEPVPIGEPVTWCHRKNGKPRRTIDFLSLNTHATRETHHTQSPFHQARSVPHGKKKMPGTDTIAFHPEDRHHYLHHPGKVQVSSMHLVLSGTVATTSSYLLEYPSPEAM